jgi:hypothetical protein
MILNLPIVQMLLGATLAMIGSFFAIKWQFAEAHKEEQQRAALLFRHLASEQKRLIGKLSDIDEGVRTPGMVDLISRQMSANYACFNENYDAIALIPGPDVRADITDAFRSFADLMDILNRTFYGLSDILVMKLKYAENSPNAIAANERISEIHGHIGEMIDEIEKFKEKFSSIEKKVKPDG